MTNPTVIIAIASEVGIYLGPPNGNYVDTGSQLRISLIQFRNDDNEIIDLTAKRGCTVEYSSKKVENLDDIENSVETSPDMAGLTI